MQILKKITMLAFLMSAFAVGAMAQLTGTRNVPGDYATVAAAVTDLNTQGVGAGGVTFIVADNYTETAPAGGFTITNPTGNGAANPIVFRRGNTGGARPIFTASAALTAGSLTDAIFKIIGTDNITIDGFSMLENAANTTITAGTNNMNEFGVALFYATTTNGSQNVTVQNCIIDLDRTYQNTFGVYSNSTHSATSVTTTATATTTDGGNSGLRLFSNSITDVNIGIVVVGPTAAADNNDGLDIGGAAAATGNSVTNYGTTGTFSGFANVSGTVNGILVRNTRNFNVSFNSIVSSNGGVIAGTLRGVYVPAFTNAPTGTIINSVNNNNISLRSGLAGGAMLGIVNEATTVSTTTTLNINNNDFTNFGHTVSGTAAITFISQAAATLNTNINNNTFTNMSVNTTGSVTFITNSVTHPAGAATNVNNNSVVTGFTKTGAGGTVFFYDSFGSTTTGTETNTGNNFSNLTFTGATTISGFRSADGASPFPSKTVTNNTFNNITNGAGAITILTVGFSPPTPASNVSGNVISNISGGAAVLGLTTSAGTQNFFSNTINTLTSTGASAVTGISITGGVTQNVFRNRIYDLSGNNAGTFVSGILVSTIPTTANVYNNLIGDLRATAATSATTPVATDAIRGINITGTTATTALNVSFNTVYLNATSTGANFSTSALFAATSTTATSATLNLRNNILVNLSTPAGTGITAAYRRSTTALDNYGAASNNNDYFAGTPSATRLIFYDGTNSDQTLAQFRTRVSPRDSSSVSENPNFLSTTGSNANFLHISTATPTQLESGGIPVTGITDDFDGQTRNASTPDIGADEFTGTGIDLSPPSILYTALGNTTATTNRTITATITDASGVAGGTNSPRIYFRKNGGAYFSTQCVLTSGSSYDCTIDYSLVGGVVANDVIDYFVVAQDSNGNVGANPGNGFAATSVNNVTSAPTTPNTYTIVTGTTGTIEVGVGNTCGAGGTDPCQYSSLTNAGGLFAGLNAAVITGNVTINLRSDLPGETGAVALNQSAEEGTGGYTVLIRPNGAARTITGTTANLIRLNGADRVTIDGSLNGGTDRSLTIVNTSTSTSGYGVWISSVNAANGATNNTVRNCSVAGNAPTTTFVGLVSSGSVLGGVAEAANNNTTFQNNAITASFFGIAMVGPTGNETGNSITGNSIGSTVAASRIGSNGIAVFQQANATVSRNTITGVVTATSGTTSGIRVSGTANGVTVNGNTITDVKNTSTSGFGANGIQLNSSTTAANVTVSNNFISDVAGFGFAGVDIADNGYGIVVASGGGYNIFYNSVNLATSQTAVGSITSAVNILAAVTTAGSIDLRDNILVNSETIGTRYAVINASTQSAAVFTDINYNDYFAQNVGRQGTIAYPLLTDWQTATGRDANSLAVDPLYVSATDLHLQTTTPLIGRGVAIASVTTDIDGDARPASNPEIGADELLQGTLALSAATYSVGEAAGNLTVTVNRTGGSVGAVAVNYALTDGTATGGAACGGTVDYVNTGGTVNFADGQSTQTFTVAICNDAALEGNETFNVTLSGATNGGSVGTPSTAVVTIVDDEMAQPGTLQFNPAIYTVGEAGPTVTLTVTRTGGTDGAVGATYALTNGTATGGATCAAGVDFINTGGTVSFTNGQASQTINVTICNDTVLEGNEMFTATLSGATGGATIGAAATATVTILDDEVAQPGTLALSAATYMVAENVSGGNVTVTVNRTGGTDGAVAVNYTLAGGTATGGATCAAGVDYINTGGTVNFANGVSTQTFTVAICNDTVFEGNETFNVTLSGATGGATIGTPATAVVTILDDEVAQNGTVQFAQAFYTVGEGGGSVTLTVTRTGGSDGAVSVNYVFAGGTASGAGTCAAGIDYAAASGTLNWANGDSAPKTFNVSICEDTLVEGNENFLSFLQSPTGGATVGTQSSTDVTITDNDTLTGPVTVTATAGTASASYNNLTEAAAAINDGTHQGAIVVSINQTITEPGTVVINSSGAGATIYTSVLIRPTADNISDSGASVQGRGLIELNGADNVTIDGDNPNSAGTNRNLTLQNTAANTVTFTSVIRVAVAATIVTSADNNAFRNLNILGSATGRNVAAATTTTGSENTTFGIFAGPGASTVSATTAPSAVASVSTSVGAGATATNLIVSNNSIGTTARGVSINGSATTVFPGLQITGNRIGTPTAGTADQVYSVGITAQGSADGVITANIVWVESYSGTALQGINVGVNSATGTYTIDRNTVNRVRNNNQGTFGAYGINLGGGSNHVVQNNFVSGVINDQTVGTGAFSTTFGAFGIRAGSGTGHRIYHNSVNLYGLIPGVVSTNLTAAFGVVATSQTGMDVRNNIFSNQITGGNPTGTRNVAVFLPSAATVALNLTLNNNAYYVGTDANNRLAQVGVTFGTGEYQAGNFDPTATTPATNFRAYTSTLSAAGTNDNASFASSAPPPFTSNVDLHIPAGTATRLESGGAAVGVATDIDLETRNATTPDIGADEFGGQPPQANDIAAVAFVTPANGATIPVGQAFAPQASFTNNGTVTQTNVTVRYRITNSSSTVIYNQTATIATIAPLQIVTATFPTTSLPAGGTYTIQASAELAGDQNTANDSISGTLTAVPPITGTVNVGAGETYTSLTNAGGIFQALNTGGISGNVVINITGDLTAETGAVALNQLAEVGAGGYTVTVRPSGAARTISGTSATPSGLIVLNGADRIIFDGSLSGGTDRSLTITNNQTALSTVIWMRSPSTTNGANNNTVRNCIINGATGAAATTTAGILTGSGVTLGSPAESPNSNNTVQNNLIYRVQNSLFVFGGATAATLDQNWVITNNELGASVTSDKNTFRGMLHGNSQNFMIAGNFIHGIQSTATTTAAMSGIQLAGLMNGGMVANNMVTDIKNISATGTGAYGINIGATSTASNVTIANNFVSDVAANGSATIGSNGFGIAFLGSGTGYNVYFNSVNLNTNQTTAQTSAAMFVNSTFATAGAINARNNIFANTQTTGTRYAVYSTAAATVFTAIDYNDYFAQNVGFIGGSARPTLADWQTATGQDANSKAVDPLFVSATDLHLQAGSPMIDMAVAGTGITTDIDGNTRGALPDIGADEAPVAPQNGTLALSAATYTVSEAMTSVTITVNRTNGTSGAVAVNYTLTGGTATGGATCAAGVDYINTGGTVNFADGQASQTFTVTLCPDSLNKVDETFNVTLSGATGGATIGTPATAVVTITNDDPTPTISINSVSLNEGNSGTTPFAFTVSLSAASGQTVTVNYFTADGTATAGSDYTAIPNTVLTFAPGTTTQTVTVLVNGDTAVEPNETFNVNLATPTNATIAVAQGIGTIVNDDVVVNLGSFSINDVRVREGNSGTVNATFTVTLTNPNGQPSSVQYATANGTATAGSDYTAVSGVLNFSAGEITKTVTVVVNGDTLREPYETFFVNLSNPIGATISDGQGLGTIIDDDRAIVADFDNDGRTDFSVFRPSNGYWYVLQSGNNVPRATLFGLNGDLPVPGDYDGDGATDIAVFRPSNGFWYILRSSDNGFTQTQFGFGTDKPVQGDFDGDGRTDIAVWRPSNGTWYVLRSGSGNQFSGVAFGASGDVPVQGDYDGDTRTDYAVYRNGVWYILNSANNAVTAVTFGASTDRPLVGDFDGDGRADYTVYRGGVWYIFQSQTNTSRAVAFGAATDIPVVGDYDRDGTSDIAVFRPSMGAWYVIQSSTGGFTSAQFGQMGDIPIPAGYQSLQ